jgi:SMP-30/Gluconolactonase/LRE-like region
MAATFPKPGDKSMKQTTLVIGVAVLAGALAAGGAMAQQPPQGPQPFSVGNRLGMPIAPAPDGVFDPMSSNVKVYGAIYSAESCSYDPGRNVIVVPNRGVGQNVQTNNGWISFINHDGSVHTARWVGVQAPAERASLTPALVFNEPSGSDIVNNTFYVSDRDGGTTPNDPLVAVIRRFDLRTGAPGPEVRVPRSTGFNDIEVADDGTIYATQTGAGGPNADQTTWQVWKITPGGNASIFIQGAPLRQPNGIAFDPQGNIVVINIGNNEVLTFSPVGRLLRTETAVQAGNDGLVILADGTKYVSSVQNGGVSRIRPGQPAELIARNIPSPASMCYDAGANQLVIPMNANNGLAFIPLN